MRILTLLVLVIASSRAQATGLPKSVQGDFVLKNFKFASGEKLDDLKFHYGTLGEPARDKNGKVTNAVLILHGTGGAGGNFAEGHGAEIFTEVLFTKSQEILDATKYFIIIPDNLGHGKSAKPSDGLRGPVSDTATRT